MKKQLWLCFLLFGAVWMTYADVVLDSFDNDSATTNGVGTDTHWNPPPDPTFIPSIDSTKAHSGSSSLKVTWEDKDLWPSFSIAQLHLNGNAGDRFFDADAIRMAIAGPGGRIILKLADADGFGTGDLTEVTVSGSDDFEVYEFPYFTSATGFPIDLDHIAEIQLLVDAGNAGSNGTIWIDTIELIRGSGENAEVVATIDNFDNDSSLEDDPAAEDSLPSGSSLIQQPFQTSIVDDPAGGTNKVIRVDYNTSPWNVLWVDELDVTDWSQASSISIDIYGEAGGILLKLKDADGKEQEPNGGFIRSENNRWNTYEWTFDFTPTVDLTRMGRLIVFIEGPSGGEGTIYFDNLTLTGDIVDVQLWALYD